MAGEEKNNIVLLGTLDTKGRELGFIGEKIQAQGLTTIVVDAGVMGEPQIRADISREEVAEAGGVSLAELQRRGSTTSDRMPLIKIMIEGATRKILGLYEQGRLDGVLAVGGSMGTAIGAMAMQKLPAGVPKLMVGTHFYPQYLGEAGLTIMQCPTDIMGLNPVTNLILAQAARAICAMAGEKRRIKKDRPLVAVTALGVTTPAVMRLQGIMEEKGYDTVVFHGNCEILDQLVEEGVIDGILDFTPSELTHTYIVQDTPQRASRLEAAGKKGLPQVVVPGSLDMIVFRVAKDQVPPAFQGRTTYLHGPYVTAVRTKGEELARMAEIVADKANRAAGPVAVVFPLRGFSAIDRAGLSFHDPETDGVFLKVMRERLKKEAQIIPVKAHILDEEFVRKVAGVYDALAKGRPAD